MTEKEEKARGFFSNSFNCAQAVLGAFCQDGGLDEKTALMLTSGLGGGARCGELCGAVAGAIIVIGLKCGHSTVGALDQKKYCNSKAYEFEERFKEANRSIVCRDLLGVDIRSPEDHSDPIAQEGHKTICPEMVTSAVRILESMEF